AFLSLRLPGRSGCKGGAATTALPGVGIRELEPAASERVAEIDNGAAKIFRAERIHERGDAVHFHEEIVRAFFVEDHGILHPRTAALLHEQAQCLACIFRLRQHVLNLCRRAGSERYDRVGCGDGFHTSQWNVTAARACVKRWAPKGTNRTERGSVSRSVLSWQNVLRNLTLS